VPRVTLIGEWPIRSIIARGCAPSAISSAAYGLDAVSGPSRHAPMRDLYLLQSDLVAVFVGDSGSPAEELSDFAVA
jgi:hypothetical protein